MTYRRGAKDDGCCSVGFLKCLLHTFNFIFLLSGCAVLGVGVWTLVAKRHHLSLLTTATYASTAYMLLLAGALVILVTALGCVAVCRLHRCFLLAYTFLLLLIFLMEAVAGIIAYVYEEQVWHELADGLNTTFVESYGTDASRTEAINDLQRAFKCCGANGFRRLEAQRVASQALSYQQHGSGLLLQDHRPRLWQVGPPLKHLLRWVHQCT
ncbi:hypothetical protein MTO96_033831 [Rhipicephalus appendiculatus]